MSKLYIIGNGFDRYHNLPTSYNDFHRFVIQNHSNLQNIFEDYFQLSVNSEYLWTDFETDLSSFNWKAFFNEFNHIDVLNENFKPSSVFGLEDELEQETEELIRKIRDAFENWLMDLSLEDTEKKLDLNENSIFLNFNYTLTLEEIYEISRDNIYHIHGDVEHNQGSLIFGHNKTLRSKPTFDKNGESTRALFSDSEGTAHYPFFALKKPVRDTIAENKKFFGSIREVSEIIVLGHSLNSIDLPYFKEIKKKVKDISKWNISFYYDSERDEHLKTLLKMGIDHDKIEFFKMNELELG
ncbi:hypothetical protein AR438_10975 [Chryseobacterium aquaticum]|uniref:Bacteriophage abortive infection AbiH n=1 Tax=Chryseobacterium aquaticum TaxID=452084 RepID=A0A0Q3HTI1_9FLAO|nr:bacteriophage abortive infection AbiH family protein [Chryseobacterium aquaticum]KQK26096.1 hypothetical protein AR438_10975 [Chryseobacterium aquaticum]